MVDSALVEGLFVLAAFALPLLEVVAPPLGRTGSWVAILGSGGKLTWVYGWYLGICLPLFRFLLLRSLWRLGLWWYLLWRLQGMELHLVPTHSDGAAGLGYLEVVHENFVPLVVAISALFSAQFAEDIFSKTMAFEGLYSWAPMIIILNAALIIGPLCIFCRKLWLCRVKGMSEYMGMAGRYVSAFDRRWIQDETATGESQLGTPDLQSLADLTNSVNVVRGMRTVPAGQRLVVLIAVCAVAPLVPLLLFKYPLDQVALRLLQMLTGM